MPDHASWYMGFRITGRAAIDPEALEAFSCIFQQTLNDITRPFIDDFAAGDAEALIYNMVAHYQAWADQNERLLDDPTPEGVAARFMVVATGWMLLMIEFGVFHLNPPSAGGNGKHG